MKDIVISSVKTALVPIIQKTEKGKKRQGDGERYCHIISDNSLSPNNTEDKERDQKDKEMVKDIVTSSVVTALVPIIQKTEKGTKKTRRW